MAQIHANNVNLRNPAVKRIMKEFAQIQSDPTSDFVAYPLEDNLYEWHFTISGPPGTEFEGGKYHGKILLPSDYPFKPPDIMILTPSGRFQTHTKICLSITGYHPKSWQPSWGIRMTLTALRAFFPTHSKGAIGGLDASKRERRKLANVSGPWKCSVCQKTNDDLLASNTTHDGSEVDKTPEAKAAEVSERPSSADADNTDAEAQQPEPEIEPQHELRQRHPSTDVTRARAQSVSVPVRQRSFADRALSILTIVLSALILLLLVRKAWANASRTPFQLDASFDSA